MILWFTYLLICLYILFPQNYVNVVRRTIVVYFVLRTPLLGWLIFMGIKIFRHSFKKFQTSSEFVPSSRKYNFTTADRMWHTQNIYYLGKLYKLLLEFCTSCALLCPSQITCTLHLFNLLNVLSLLSLTLTKCYIVVCAASLGENWLLSKRAASAAVCERATECV